MKNLIQPGQFVPGARCRTCACLDPNAWKRTAKYSQATPSSSVRQAARCASPYISKDLRGGGGNFGVVTGIDCTLYPVGREVTGGFVAWPASEAPRVLELYRTLAEEAPPELTLVTFIRPAPSAPWLPKDVHGKPIIALLACHSGNPEQGQEAVAPIKLFGAALVDILVRRPYTQLQSLLDATQPKGRRYYWKSEYLARIDTAPKKEGPDTDVGAR